MIKTYEELMSLGFSKKYLGWKLKNIKVKSAVRIIKNYAKTAAAIPLVFTGGETGEAAMNVLGKMLLYEGHSVRLVALDDYFNTVCSRGKNDAKLAEFNAINEVDFLFFTKFWRVYSDDFGISDNIRVALTSLCYCRSKSEKAIVICSPLSIGEDFERVYGLDVYNYFNEAVIVEFPDDFRAREIARERNTRRLVKL